MQTVFAIAGFKSRKVWFTSRHACRHSTKYAGNTVIVKPLPCVSPTESVGTNQASSLWSVNAQPRNGPVTEFRCFWPQIPFPAEGATGTVSTFERCHHIRQKQGLIVEVAEPRSVCER